MSDLYPYFIFAPQGYPTAVWFFWERVKKLGVVLPLVSYLQTFRPSRGSDDHVEIAKGVRRYLYRVRARVRKERKKLSFHVSCVSRPLEKPKNHRLPKKKPSFLSLFSADCQLRPAFLPARVSFEESGVSYDVSYFVSAETDGKRRWRVLQERSWFEELL